MDLDLGFLEIFCSPPPPEIFDIIGVMKSYEVSDQLMHYIIDHKLKEGDKLPNEYELADIFQVSRKAIRQAVSLLVDESILEIRRGKGTFLTDHSKFQDPTFRAAYHIAQLDRLIEAMELRCLIEPSCAACATRSPQPMRESIQEGFDLADQEHESDAYYRDFYFHQKIIECSLNSLIRSILPIVSYSISHVMKLEPEIVREQVRFDHQKINEAIQNQNEEEAEQMMLSHLKKIHSILVSMRKDRSI